MLDAVVYQLADDPIENHFDVGIETLGMQIGRKMNLHAAVRQPADKIGHGASQSEVFQNMRAQIDRNLAQTADGLVDYVAGVSQNLAAALVGLIGRQRRNGHLGRREQRPQPVVQILRETQPLFFLGAQHGIQYAALADPALVLGTGDVVENPLDEQHAERDAERRDDAHPHEKLRRQAQDRLQARDLDVFGQAHKRHARKSHREQHPRKIVLGPAYQADRDDGGHDLQYDGNDQQNFDNHKPFLMTPARPPLRISWSGLYDAHGAVRSPALPTYKKNKKRADCQIGAKRRQAVVRPPAPKTVQSLRLFRKHSLLFLDTGFLAGQTSQIVDAGPTHDAYLVDLDMVDVGRIEREDTFHADAVGNLTDREHFGNTAALDLNYGAAETLQTLLAALDDPVRHGNRVAALERGDVRLHPHGVLGDLDQIIHFDKRLIYSGNITGPYVLIRDSCTFGVQR